MKDSYVAGAAEQKEEPGVGKKVVEAGKTAVKDVAQGAASAAGKYVVKEVGEKGVKAAAKSIATKKISKAALKKLAKLGVSAGAKALGGSLGGPLGTAIGIASAISDVKDITDTAKELSDERMKNIVGSLRKRGLHNGT